MLVASKKIKYIHEISFKVNRRTYKMNTDFDVCVGDICLVSIAKNNYYVPIENIVRKENKEIIDPRIQQIYFDVDTKYSYIDEYQSKYIYSVKLINNDRSSDYSYFLSDVILLKDSIVISNNNIGVVEGLIDTKIELVNDKVIEVYNKCDQGIYKVYASEFVPRYLLNELISKYFVLNNMDNVSNSNNQILFEELIIGDEYQFDYPNNDNLIYLINLARINNKTAQSFMIDFCERNGLNEELEFWKKKISQ